MKTSPLVRLFVARFFENDFTGGGGDLRSSFFWLLAFLAPIGLLMPWTRSFQHTCYFLVGGPELFRFLAIEDKAFYLGLGMVATGAIGVVTWPSFLPDRREVLVLGALPVSGQAIVRAKLVAVLGYAAMLAAGMHALSSVSFGLLLTNGQSFGFVLRSIGVHFVVACLASVFPLLVILGCQALLAAISTPPVFRRLSPLLQIATASTVLGILITLPAVASALVYADARWNLAETRRVVRACAPGLRAQLGADWHSVQAWADLTPVPWFAGLYEQFLGGATPRMHALASTASVAGLLVIAVIAVAYPIAARRMMRAEVEGTASGARSRLGRSLLASGLRLLARRPAHLAAMQFFSATLFRVSSHRFVVAIGVGMTLAMIVPAGIEGLRALQAATSAPSIALLSLPPTIMLGAIATMSVVASLPSDLNAAWIFRLVSVGAGQARSALRRAMVAGGVVAPVILLTPVYWAYWGQRLALVHGAVCLMLGLLLVELALRGFRAVPCSVPWSPNHPNLRTWWPAYIAAFFLITQGPPRVSVLVQQSPLGLALVLSGLLVVQLWVRWASGRRVVPIDQDDLLAPDVLHLQ